MRSSLLARLGDLWTWLARHAEQATFSVLALACLTPIWAFAYIPTQDGPAHVNNAQIIKDCGNPESGLGDFFEVRAEPMPNLTAHFLLAGMLYVLPPLIAEKALVSLYVLAFAGAFRYYLGAFGPRCVPMSWIGLLLVFNRCFWMGFYNYCLGMALLWLIVGYCLRRRDATDWRQFLVLSILFTMAYFTHLVAFLLAVLAALTATILVSPRRLLHSAVIISAALPAMLLTAYYFQAIGFFRAQPVTRIGGELMARVRPASLGKDLLAIDDELYAHHVGAEVPGSLVLVFLLVILTVFTFARSRSEGSESKDGVGRSFPAAFGTILFTMYLLVPNDLNEHGGFIKTRLAPLFFLTWLGCLRESSHFEARLFCRGVTVILLALNLLLVIDTFAVGNRQLEAYHAGIGAAGTGHRLFVIQADPRPVPLVNPLLHAADYYCLGTHNVNLDNYEAEALHFPVKFRTGVQRGRNHWNAYPNKDVIDTVLCWQPVGTSVPRPPAGWPEIFRAGSLRLYRRPDRR